ncbi:hypothetical protein NHQ30_008767 [Ciborinia camelliae]|nr:hypothetical protein NHQ30_008767 [Ciborinia camelliae]
MARPSHIADSDASGSSTGESSNTENVHTSITKPDGRPESVLAHRSEEPNQNIEAVQTNGNTDEAEDYEMNEDGDGEGDEYGDEDEDEDEDNTIVVMVPAPKNPEEYVPYQDDTVDSVLEELTGSDGEILYKVEYEDERQDTITYNRLMHLPNGNNALDMFTGRESPEAIPVDRPSNSSRSLYTRAGKRIRHQPTNNDFVDISNIQLSSEDERSAQNSKKKRRLVKNNMSTFEIEKARRSTRIGSQQPSRPIFDDDDDDEEEEEEEDDSQSELAPSNVNGPRRSGRATRSAAPRKANTLANYMEEDEDELAGDVKAESEDSDIAYAKPKKSRISNTLAVTSKPAKRGRPRTRGNQSDDSSEWSRELPSRISGRGNKTGKNMRERDVDEEIYADEVAGKATPKVISIREIYQQVSAKSSFGSVHDQDCDVCGGTGKKSNKGTSNLIYCQGCSTSIHKICLGYRAGRDHMVTKVGHEHFVMQCRRCIGLAVKKDPLAPKLGACSSCNEPGPSCAAFSVKKTAKQEEKLREENDGDDPINNVPVDLVNNPANVLFRCRGCQRGFHYEHLPPLHRKSAMPQNAEDLRSHRFKEYTKNWQCKECSHNTTKLQTLVAWRLSDRKSYTEGAEFDDFREDEKEYLVKWVDKSYFKCSWMPGPWVWGVAAGSMRKAFIRRDEGANMLPKWTEEEAISEEYLRMEIVFDVEYDDSFEPTSEEHDKAHINEVAQVLVKFRGLTYDESVWEEPPSPNEADRWSDFVSAYHEYVMGKYFVQSPAIAIKERINAFRSLDFQKKVLLKKQPASLIGGEMMPYQMEGLNWLLYNFHQQKNVILADEMGLGKTIQVISLIASLVKDKPKCSPFLIVTPNSTCPNWRREIKKWAPGLRVVAYYGAKAARDMAMKYELYPDGCSDLRAHVVVTSYEAPVDDSSRVFFKKIKWAGMIVDEGQRLKNDGNLLYGALTALKIPFQVLLSGTPLQNNKRELFNLLQFLDDSIDAAKLDEKYAKLTKENLPEIHELIRPFFLRRTKREVLKFLPPMAQTIIPVSMSVVQKQLYKSILSKNPELINSIIGKTNQALRPTERGNLNNILMQLRKCLCHPFLYSSAIEETSLGHEALHRNLIDASSKFQLLEIMLPKLQARGHRVLLFSQFLKHLDLVEDFLNGLDLPYQRLDGSVSTLEKQKRIDAFNAPNSPLFAFLLSTRAGGVGINLATADTVIIMDPDFNPHQDIQALSRAHRIGQKKKVLVFQLVTKNSAEEQIVQIGRQKMALDQALIESMDLDDEEEVDLEAILRFGAEAVLNDDDSKDVYYDSESVDQFLDRSQIENPDPNGDKTAESQYSHARVWIKDKGALVDDFEPPDPAQAAPNGIRWDIILKQRAADVALEAAQNMQTFGRGKRARQTVYYDKSQPELNELDDAEDSPQKNARRRRKSNSDDEFAGNGAKDSEAEDSDAFEDVDPRELEIDLPGLKGTKSKFLKRVDARRSPHQSKRKMDVKGGNNPRIGVVPIPLSSLEKSVDNYIGDHHGQPILENKDTPQLLPHRRQIIREAEPWMEEGKYLERPWGRDADYQRKLQDYQRQSKEWLERGNLLIEEGSRQRSNVELGLQQGEVPKSRSLLNDREIQMLRQLCDQERDTAKEFAQEAQQQTNSDRNNPGLCKKRKFAEHQQEVDNHYVEGSGPGLQGLAAMVDSHDQDYKKWYKVFSDSNFLIRDPQQSQQWLDQGKVLFEVGNLYVQELEGLDEKLPDVEKKCRETQTMMRSDLENQVFFYKQEILTAWQQEINGEQRQLQEQRGQINKESQQQTKSEPKKRGPYKKRSPAENQAAGYPEMIPQYPQPLPEATPTHISNDYLYRMSMPLIDPLYPKNHSEGTSFKPFDKPFYGPQGSRVDPIQVDSDSNLSNRSTPVIRSTPAIEIPAKRKRGRPSLSTSSRLSSSMTPVPISSMTSRPNVHSCPGCNFVCSALVPSCPCNASTSKIRLMLDNLKGIKDDPEQVADATKVLKEALASKLASRKSSGA